MSESFRARIISLRQDEVVLPTGRRMTLDIVHHPGAAAVVAAGGEILGGDENGTIWILLRSK